MPSVEDVKANLVRKSLVVSQMLATPGGQALLEIIEAEFVTGKTGKSLLGADPQRTAYNIGAYDVVLYLQQLQRFNANQKAAVDPLA
jgi:hypothetical protein